MHFTTPRGTRAPTHDWRYPSDHRNDNRFGNANAILVGQETTTQVRPRSPRLESKLTAFRSSLSRRSYHHSSDLRTNFPRKFSLSQQGKYIEVYTLSLTYLFVARVLLHAPTRRVARVGMMCHVIRGIDCWQITQNEFPSLFVIHQLDQSIG